MNDSDRTQTRRSFIQNSAGITGSLDFLTASRAWSKVIEPGEERDWALDEWNPRHSFLLWGETLRVQPILMYTVATPKKEQSWRSWGGVLSDTSSAEELTRITREMRSLAHEAEFPLEILAPKKVKTNQEVEAVLRNDCDVALVYAASGSGRLLEGCIPSGKDAIIFVRHRSGPIYYWYEALSVAYLANDREEFREGDPPRLEGTHVDDVVVDDYTEVLWRLRALYGVKNLLGSRILALGGVWGKYAADAPRIARETFQLDIVEMSYEQVELRIRNALNKREQISQAEERTEEYLALGRTMLKTDKQFMVNAFILYDIFKRLMIENRAPAFTIKECMSIIMPLAKTTACLTLSLLNDEGLLAFCESDFVVIPAGILLRHISSKPVFLHNSTFPHDAMVTSAHCSAPRRMNGDRYEPTTIFTHEESDYGAAPKVEVPIGQEVTLISPEYTRGRWVGFRGNVESNPFYEICRSQQDVRIQGRWKELIHEVRDSHWMMCYGGYLREMGYAARRLGVCWANISDL